MVEQQPRAQYGPTPRMSVTNQSPVLLNNHGVILAQKKRKKVRVRNHLHFGLHAYKYFLCQAFLFTEMVCNILQIYNVSAIQF